MRPRNDRLERRVVLQLRGRQCCCPGHRHGDNPSLSELIGPVKVMLQAYDEGRLDKLYIVSNKFINTMSQVPTISQLLPLPASDDDDLKHKSTGLPVRTRSEGVAGYPAASLCRISGLSGRG